MYRYNTFSMKSIVAPEQAKQRLDLLCGTLHPQVSRAVIQRAIKDGSITVNGKTVKPGYLVRVNDAISIALDDTKTAAEPVVPAPLPAIEILYEDKDMVVVNKPAGVAVYAGVGQESGTLAHWFSERYPAAKKVGEADRPGIVHRLDKETSGVVVLAKTPEALEFLMKQFAQRRVQKEYVALVFGVPGEKEGRITRSIGRSRNNPMRRTVDPEGREAVTEWKFLEKFGDDYALLQAWPLTGRPHQIRVHFHFLSHPIVGDHLYAIRKQRPPQGVKHQLLHAEKLTITLLSGSKRTFTAPLPEDFARILENLRHDVRG